jgi:hypothetical protein
MLILAMKKTSILYSIAIAAELAEEAEQDCMRLSS